MEDTLCFWDGNEFTDRTAPALPEWRGPDLVTIAGGVALGVIGASIIGWVVFYLLLSSSLN